MSTIGHFSLSNEAGMYVCAIDIKWWDSAGVEHRVSNAAKDIALYQCKSADPGANGIPNGATVVFVLNVKSAVNIEITASERFTYQSGNTTYANYAAGGITFKPDLTFVGTGANICDRVSSKAPEQKAAEPASD